MRTVLAILILGVIPLVLKGQAVIVQGENPPSPALRGDWYLDTLAHKAYYKKDSRWSPVITNGLRVNFLTPCANMVMLKMEFACSLMAASGKVFKAGTDCECLDNIVRLAHPSTDEFFNAYSYMGVSVNQENSNIGMSSLRPDTVNGEPGLCITSLPLSLSTIAYIHGWGYLGFNGQWLIQPIYDHPFRFENGVANVFYYGQRRKINEKGERVE